RYAVNRKLKKSGKVRNYYCKPCERFKEICNGAAHDICRKIRNNLKNIYSISPGKERKQHCLYFKYWFYEKLMNLFNSESGSKCFNSIITEFDHFKVYAYYGYIDFSCQYDLYRINMNNLKTHKLYNDIYKEYLNSIFKLYIKYKSDECSSDDYNYLYNNCENFFDPHEYYNPQNLLSTLESCIPGQEIPKNIINEKYLELENNSPKIKLKCSEGSYWIDDKFVRSMICTDKQKGDIEHVSMKASPSFSYYQIIFNGIFYITWCIFLLFLFFKV
ncbi:hypothetical protein PCYB_003570, partial [Plasmodium cynomolgi strain B]